MNQTNDDEIWKSNVSSYETKPHRKQREFKVRNYESLSLLHYSVVRNSLI